MLISTSRKPSPKTRSFCKNLSHALDFTYVNRGKMSMRNLFLKSSHMNYDLTLLVYEIKGNPSKITFFSNDGDEKLAILVSVSTTRDRLNINTNEIKVKCDLPELAIFGELLGYENSIFVKENYIHIQKVYQNNDDKNKKNNDYKNKNYENKRNNKPEMDKIAIIDFYNKEGNKTNLKISVKKILIN